MRASGTKNLGTSNALMLLGWKSAIIICVHDMGKAALAVFLMRWIFPGAELAAYVAGTAAVLGHIFPFYLKFKGGKGYASFLGMALALDWKFGLILLVAVGLLVFITDYIVAGTVMSVIAYPVYVGIIQNAWPAALIISVASIVILIKHRKNCVRIWNNTEPLVSKVFSDKSEKPPA